MVRSLSKKDVHEDSSTIICFSNISAELYLVVLVIQEYSALTLNDQSLHIYFVSNISGCNTFHYNVVHQFGAESRLLCFCGL